MSGKLQTGYSECPAKHYPRADAANFRNIPECLKQRPQWVIWRAKWNEEKQKFNKPPLNPSDGGFAKSNDSSTWTTNAQAVARFTQDKSLTGIGFEVTEDDPFTVVDMDDCILPDGAITPIATAVVKTLNSYTEVSPSGTGLRIVVLSPRVGKSKRKKFDGGEIEIYSEGQYLAFTGNHLEGSVLTVEPREAELRSIYEVIFGHDEPANEPGQREDGSPGDYSTWRDVPDEEIIRLLCGIASYEKLWNGNIEEQGNDHSAADFALCCQLAYYTGKDTKRIDALFRKSKLLRPKWDSVRADSTYGWDTIAKAVDTQDKVWKPPPPKFKLTTMKELLAEPDEQNTFIVDGKMSAGGFSVLASKPKVGKSTLARGLCVRVAHGDPFLGCHTVQGPVIYFGLEDKRGEIKTHFRSLGATEQDPIHIHSARAPQNAMAELCRLVKELKPVLVVIDPLFKFIHVKDEKSYAELTMAMEPLLVLARDTGAHVLVTHHNGKLERADSMDEILGSTAIFAAVDGAIVLKKSDRYRTIRSCQRYGEDWPETVLNFDALTHDVTIGVPKAEAEAERLGEAILVYLAGCAEPQTRPQVEENVEGKTGPLRKALTGLVKKGRILKSGTGNKNDPFRFF